MYSSINALNSEPLARQYIVLSSKWFSPHLSIISSKRKKMHDYKHQRSAVCTQIINHRENIIINTHYRKPYIFLS